MKILRLISSLDPANGGPVEGIMQIDKYLVMKGHDVHVVTTDPVGSLFGMRHPGVVYNLGGRSGLYSYSKYYKKWLLENCLKYDFAIINGVWQYHSIAGREVFMGEKLPFFVFTHGMLDPWFKKNYRIKHFKKSIYWLLFERKVLRDARAVLFTSQEEMRLSATSFLAYRCNPIVVPYGTSGAPQNVENKLSLNFFDNFPDLKNKRILLFLSRIHEKKGCDILLDAFAKVSQLDDSIYLVMAGPDNSDYATDLKKRADVLGVGNKVVWAGMLTGDLKWGAYYSAEAFVLPSHQENFGIVVAEALSCGCPVLITNKVNIWREVLDAQAGLVSNDDVDGVEKALREWIGLSSADRQKYSHNAVNCFLKNFHVEKAADKIIDLGCLVIGVKNVK